MFTLQDEVLFWVMFSQSPRATERQAFRRWWPDEAPQLARGMLRQNNTPLASSGRSEVEQDGVGEGQLSKEEIS